MAGEESSAETLPLNTNGGSIAIRIINKYSDQKRQSHNPDISRTFYEENSIIHLNEKRQKKLVFGYLRHSFIGKINAYSIPIDTIFNYYNNIDDIYPGKYLLKHQYFTNSVHIDSNSIGSNDADLWPRNLLSHHDAFVKYKFRSMVSYLILVFILSLMSIILFATHQQGIAIASVLGSVIITPCAFISIFIFYKSYTRQYKLLNFNVETQMIQEWIYTVRHIKTMANEPHDVCQLIAVNNVCSFSDLNTISFTRPYVVRHRDTNGNRSQYYHDGCVRFITYYEKSIPIRVSYHSEWIGMYERIQNIMNGIQHDWFDSIEWSGFI
eukprot:564984_1